MSIMTRRQLLQTAGAGAASLALAPLAGVLGAEGKKEKTGFKMVKLPYDYDALEKAIDARTMEIHYSKHYATYVTGLNAAVKDHPKLQTKSLEELLRGIKEVPEKIRTAVRNMGGGAHNHALFWYIMSPKGGSEPSGPLAKAIDNAFGSFDKFQKQLSQAAITRFGSGWGWLVLSDAGKLKVMSTANQDSPLMEGHTPLLGVDVWEHAYYLRYQNLRPKYVENWWKVVNWPEVARRYEKAKSRE
jgi:Fe-Mn family superoxide dismutase